MRDTFVDVRLEVPTSELRGLPDAAQQVVERMRDSADRLCAESGARLRTGRRAWNYLRRFKGGSR